MRSTRKILQMNETIYHYDIQQNTEAWHDLRCGKITASQVGDFVTPAKWELSGSKTMQSAIYRIAGERLTGRPKVSPTTPAMAWGHEHQDAAIRLYERIQGVSVSHCGFVTSAECDRIGCSPDGLVRHFGGVEVKCPMHVEHHLAVLQSGAVPIEHRLQIAGSLWITARLWWDYVSYHPWLPDIRQAFVCIRTWTDGDRMKVIGGHMLAIDSLVESTIKEITCPQQQQ